MMNASEEELLQQLNDKKIREYAGTIAYSALVVFLGIIGNSFTVAFYGFKVSRTTTNVIITALSVVDLIVCVVISCEIIELCFTLTFKNAQGCKAKYFFTHTLVLTSVSILFLVAIDRFRRLCMPFRWQLSVKTAKVSVLVIIIVSVLMSIPTLVIFDVVPVPVYDSDNFRNITAFYCTHTKDDSLQTTIKFFQVIDLLVFVLGTLLLVVLYSLISYRLWVTRKRFKREYPSRTVHSESSTASVENSTSPKSTGEEFSKERKHTLKSDLTASKNLATDSPFNQIGKEIERPNPEISEEEINKDIYNIPVKTVDQLSNENIEVTDNIDNDLEVPAEITLPRSRKTKDKTQITRHTDRTVTLMMLTISVAFIISFLPYFTIVLGIKLKTGSSEQEFNAGIQTALRSFMLNNAVNPYIIGLFNPKFRSFVKELLCRCCFMGRN